MTTATSRLSSGGPRSGQARDARLGVGAKGRVRGVSTSRSMFRYMVHCGAFIMRPDGWCRSAHQWS